MHPLLLSRILDGHILNASSLDLCMYIMSLICRLYNFVKIYVIQYLTIFLSQRVTILKTYVTSSHDIVILLILKIRKLNLYAEFSIHEKTIPGKTVPGELVFLGAIFPGTNFPGTIFPGTNFPGTIFSETILLSDHFSGDFFPGDHFSGTIFPRTEFSYKSLSCQRSDFFLY